MGFIQWLASETTSGLVKVNIAPKSLGKRHIIGILGIHFRKRSQRETEPELSGSKANISKFWRDAIRRSDGTKNEDKLAPK